VSGSGERAWAGERTGILVVRAWIEPGAGGGLRARITATSDVAAPVEVVTVCSSVEGVVATVTQWIDAFVGSTAGVLEGQGDGAVT
jgi:hypothetical protein